MKDKLFRMLPIVAVAILLLGLMASAASAMPAGQGGIDPDGVLVTPPMPTSPVSPGEAPDTLGMREPEWTTFFYSFPPGSGFHSTSDAMGSNYNSGACINATGNATEFFTIYLDLPEGSRIDYVRLYYRDTSSSNSMASLRKYDGAGNTNILGTVDSTGNGGFGYQVSPYIGHIVDNSNGAYALNWRPIVVGTAMQLCGMRVAYRLATSATYLPSVQRR